MMVPWYEMAVDLTVAVVLLLTAVYSSLLLKKPMPRWLELGLAAIGIVLIGGVTFALMNGHWPFR
jgi:hypothetical protein